MCLNVFDSVLKRPGVHWEVSAPTEAWRLRLGRDERHSGVQHSHGEARKNRVPQLYFKV